LLLNNRPKRDAAPGCYDFDALEKLVRRHQPWVFNIAIRMVWYREVAEDEYFGVASEVGGEVMEVSPDNFRQLLSRARRDLYQFMNEKCGLVNAANPCRCAKKTRAFMQAGYVDPDRLEFTKGRLASASDVAPHRLNELETLARKHAELFRDHGFLAAPDLATRLRELISQSGVDAEIESAR
jgi:hypothetical protein